MQVPCAPNGFKLALQLDYLLLKDAAVSLDLRLSRSTKEAGAATLALEVGPATYQPSTLVLKVRQIHLQRAFSGARATTEDLQNNASSIEDLGVQTFFQIALLHRRQRMIDEDQLDFVLRHQFRNLLKLASADQGRGTRIVDGHDLGMDRFEIDGACKSNGLVQARLWRARRFRARCLVGAPRKAR